MPGWSRHTASIRRRTETTDFFRRNGKIATRRHQLNTSFDLLCRPQQTARDVSFAKKDWPGSLLASAYDRKQLRANLPLHPLTLHVVTVRNRSAKHACSIATFGEARRIEA